MLRNRRITTLIRFACLLIAVPALASAAVIAGKDRGGERSLNLTPFARVADLKDADDPAKATATAFARYVATVNDTGNPTNVVSDSVLGGPEWEVTTD